MSPPGRPKRCRYRSAQRADWALASPGANSSSRRRARRRPFLRRRRHRAACAGSGGGARQDARSERRRWLPRGRRRRQRDDLLRQGRPRPGLAHRDSADGGRGAGHRRRPHRDDRGRHRADAGPGGDGRQLRRHARRRADPPGRGHRARSADRPGGRARSAGRPPSSRRATARSGRRPAGGRYRFGELVGDKRFGLKVDPKAPLQEPGHLHGRRQAARATRRSRARSPAGTSSCTTSRSTGCCTAACCGRRASARSSSRSTGARSRTITGARVVRFNDFVGVLADDEWAAITAAKALKLSWSDERTLIGNDGVRAWMRAGPFEADEFLVQKGRHPAGACGCRQAPVGRILLADADARLDGTLVRGGRRARRQGDDLERVAGDASVPR